jgi:hypothetical protein
MQGQLRVNRGPLMLNSAHTPRPLKAKRPFPPFFAGLVADHAVVGKSRTGVSPRT